MCTYSLRGEREREREKKERRKRERQGREREDIRKPAPESDNSRSLRPTVRALSCLARFSPWPQAQYLAAAAR
jgi:hypothetical protein